jgi:membrane protein
MTKVDWKDLSKRVKAEAKADNITLLAAGVALYGLLAMVPGLVALISGYGLFADPNDVEDQVVDALSAAPEEVRTVITQQLTSIVESEANQARLGVIVGLAFAIWAASSGIAHLIEALNVAYDEEETRGWVRRKALALMLTIGTVLFVLVAFASIALLPALLAESGLGQVGRWIAGGVRWVILLGGMVIGLAVLYRYGPDRKNAVWRWISPGAVFAAVVWLLASIAFSIYTANFGRYNETYGSLGAIVVVMLWLVISAAAVLLGAELNAELERATGATGPEDATDRSAGGDSTGAGADPAVDVDHEVGPRVAVEAERSRR